MLPLGYLFVDGRDKHLGPFNILHTSFCFTDENHHFYIEDNQALDRRMKKY